MHKYRVNYTPIGVGGEGKVLEVKKLGSGDSNNNGTSGGGEDEVMVMKQRICFHAEDANRGLNEV